MPTDSQSCVFDPTTNEVVDLLRRNESEVEALVRLAPYGLHLVVLPLDEARRRREAAARRPPVAIARGRFDAMLNLRLPVA